MTAILQYSDNNKGLGPVTIRAKELEERILSMSVDPFFSHFGTVN